VVPRQREQEGAWAREITALGDKKWSLAELDPSGGTFWTLIGLLPKSKQGHGYALVMQEGCKCLLLLSLFCAE